MPVTNAARKSSRLNYCCNSTTARHWWWLHNCKVIFMIWMLRAHHDVDRASSHQQESGLIVAEVMEVRWVANSVVKMCKGQFNQVTAPNAYFKIAHWCVVFRLFSHNFQTHPLIEFVMHVFNLFVVDTEINAPVFWNAIIKLYCTDTPFLYLCIVQQK